MSHEIDESNGRSNIAYVGEAPWHGLGQVLTTGADIETWRREAGLDYEVLRAPVLFDLGEDKGPRNYPERHVLYRSDTKKPLSVVSDGYNIVQPGEVLDFVAQCVKHAGFEMEVAGGLNDGRKVWALAKVNDGAPVIGRDIVRPYLLAATSYDATMSSTFKFTAVRVVCKNTLTMAAGGTWGLGQIEKDISDGVVVECVRVAHSKRPDFEVIRQQLGIVVNAWDQFLVNARLLAGEKVSEKFSAEFFRSLLATERTEAARIEAEGTRAFAKLMAIVKGEAPSATLPEAQGTMWGTLNAVTWLVDHERGSDKTRLHSAWFGSGEGLKKKALDMLVETVS